MSNVAVLEQSINGIAPSFNDLAEIHGAVNFKREASFAIQALKNNDYLMRVAYENPESLQFAVLNVAAIGLSLNPALKQAYLVPRRVGGENRVVLDIPYLGLVHLACESGAIKWMQAQLVYSKDTFRFLGVGERPHHEFDAFGDRGDVVGVYSVSKTEDGEYLCDFMRLDEVFAIRDRTDAWKSFKAGRAKSCPWATDEGEMIKKTMIKRAYKLLPKNDKAGRLAKAVDVLNEHEGIDFDREEPRKHSTQSQVEEIKGLISELKRTEKDFLGYFGRVLKREVAAVEELSIDEAEQALIQLRNFKKPEAKNEDDNATA